MNPEDIPDKDVIVLAGFWVDYDLKKRIIDYNKESDKYRVVITEYQMYNTGDDYMAGYTKLNNDILAGKIPDIIVVDTNIKIENYVSKGLLADVGALIAKDEELSQKEFMENVFEAYKVDGKLYCTPWILKYLAGDGYYQPTVLYRCCSLSGGSVAGGEFGAGYCKVCRLL